jgi:hypothetical protein
MSHNNESWIWSFAKGLKISGSLLHHFLQGNNSGLAGWGKQRDPQ